jgi:hypothetical protein
MFSDSPHTYTSPSPIKINKQAQHKPVNAKDLEVEQYIFEDLFQKY